MSKYIIDLWWDHNKDLYETKTLMTEFVYLIFYIFINSSSNLVSDGDTFSSLLFSFNFLHIV